MEVAPTVCVRVCVIAGVAFWALLKHVVQKHHGRRGCTLRKAGWKTGEPGGGRTRVVAAGGKTKGELKVKLTKAARSEIDTGRGGAKV